MPPRRRRRASASGSRAHRSTSSTTEARALQIQPLANFGKANPAWSTCRSRGDTTCTTLRNLLDAMLSLAAQPGTFTAFEYDFFFEGGVPPWMSGMAQATGIQALEYHTLLRDIVDNLCRRVGTPIYCDSAARSPSTSSRARRPGAIGAGAPGSGMFANGPPATAAWPEA